MSGNNDFWNGDTADWATSLNWTILGSVPTVHVVPSGTTDATIIGGAVTIGAGENDTAEVVGVGSSTAASLTTGGQLTAGELDLSNAVFDGTGEITTNVLYQIPGEFAIATTFGGSLTVVATGAVEIGGGQEIVGLDHGLTIGAGASLISDGTASIDQGIIKGAGTLQNGTSSDSAAVMTFAPSQDFGDGDTAIGTFVNFRQAGFSGSPNGTGDGDDFSATSIVNDGTMAIGSGFPTFGLGNDGAGQISGSGEILLEGDASVELDAGVGSGQTIQFGTGPNVLRLDGTTSDLLSSFQAKLSGLALGDIIDLASVPTADIATVGLATYSTGLFTTGTELTVQFTNATTVDFKLAQPWNPALIVAWSDDAGGGTDLLLTTPPINDWTNGEGDGEWTTPGNWSIPFNGGIPTSAETAEITDATVTIGQGDIADAGTLLLIETVAGTVHFAGGPPDDQNKPPGCLLIDEGSLFLQNGLTLGNGVGFALNGGSLGFASSTEGVTVDQGGEFQGYGSFEQLLLLNNGTVDAESGHVLSLASLTGTGTVDIEAGATADLPDVGTYGGGGTSEASLTVNFGTANAAPGTLGYSYQPGSFTGPMLQNLTYGDAISIEFEDDAHLAIYHYQTSDGSTDLLLTDGVSTATFDLGAPSLLPEFVVTYSNGVLRAVAADNIPPIITVPSEPVLILGDTADTAEPIAAPLTTQVSVGDADTQYLTCDVTVAITGGSGSLAMNTDTGGGTMKGALSGSSLNPIIGTTQEIAADLSTLAFTPTVATSQLTTVTVTATNNGPSSDAGSNAAAPQSFDILTLPADAANFEAVQSGDWASTTPATWSGGGVPGVGDDAVVAGSFDVTVDTAEAAGSLTIAAPQATVDVIYGGVLTVASGIDVLSGALDLEGGTVGGGTADPTTKIVLGGGNFDTSLGSSGTFSNVAVQGELVVTGRLTIESGFAITSLTGSGPGSIQVNASNEGFPVVLDFADAEKLSDVDISLTGSALNEGYGQLDDAQLEGANLTLDVNSMVTANEALITGASVTNDGLITATGYLQVGAVSFDNAASGKFIDNGASSEVTSTTFANAGNVTVENDAILTIASGVAFNDTGNVTVEHDALFAIASGAAVSGTGNVWMSTGSTADVSAPVTSGSWYFGDPATLILNDPSGFDATIGGLGTGDQIQLPGQTVTGGDIMGTTLTLDLSGGGTQTFAVQPGQSGLSFTTTGTGGLSVACFRTGTFLATPRGDVPVETLRVGDLVRTVGGASAPVVWLGHRGIDCRRHPHPHPHAMWPIRVAAGAFAEGKPSRDLWLSPDHAVFVDGVLVPIRHLVNGTTIAQERCATVTYWHVELPRHDILLAEGLPCESFLDTGNRCAFARGGVVDLHPDFSRHVWDGDACAKLVVGGPHLEKIRARLSEYADHQPIRRAARH